MTYQQWTLNLDDMNELQFECFGVIFLICIIVALTIIYMFHFYFTGMKVHENKFLAVLIGIILGCGIWSCTLLTDISDIPSAMEYHKGMTTVEYTVRNGVKVDSVIVFKDKIKK